ncbi:penicillin-binding protein [Dictyoglomus thermophilum H-6-12]|uniref:Penicillin-binding protein n=1 Tax=Dictyoglomus thermophilum (strain ATCC 35947 / DSM 3960 / H-6-12) TaxID=309799 RepID=B5YCG3_DICT6|nr:penicillin-binding protein [Dictyoglomus thermophilum H-6-12]
MGLSLDPDDLIKTSKEFGVGEPTFIDLPNEKLGYRISVEAHKRKYNRDILGGTWQTWQ